MSAADERGFIPLPLPAPVAAPRSPAPSPRADIERSRREIRLRFDARRLERGASGSDVQAWHARELRALERETGAVPPGHAARVRADLERAQRRLELDRRLERVERKRGASATQR